MERRARWLRSLAALGAMLLLLAACGEAGNGDDGDGNGTGAEEEAPEFSTIEDGILTVGSDIPYKPFEFRQDGELVGLDIDLMNEISSRLGLETPAEFIDTDFDTIFAQLAGGRYDAVIAASTITPERAEQVNFSDPYYNSQQSLTINTQESGDIQSTDDLGDGHTIAVQSGTTGKAWAEENLDDAVEIRSFPQGPDGYTALEAGDVDAVINDEPTALSEIEDRQNLEIAERIDTGEAYGIAVDPSNEELLEAINQALGEIIEDGTYEEIYSRYPDLPPGGSVAANE